jgi:hypothetical protein
LKSYPEIYKKLEKFEGAFDERVRYLLEKYRSNIMGPDKFAMFDTIDVKGKGFLGKHFSTTELKRRDVPWTIYYGFPKGITDEEIKKTEEYKEINELRDFLEGTRQFNERLEIYRELAGDLAWLSQKIEMGQPLEGKCSLCPRVRILEEK